MNLQALISRFRTDANDKAAPYFWSDEEVTAWLNDAVNEAAIRGRLIHESSDPSICLIVVTPGQSTYQLHPSIYELDYLSIELDGEFKPLCLISQEDLSNILPDWRTAQGDPEYAIQSDTGLRLAPKPIRAATIYLEGYRKPKADMALITDTPEINESHHVHLVHWALHRAFSIPDSESFDPNRSGMSEMEFTRYFGHRPDSDMRRMTREDYQHHIKPFWV